MSIHLSDHFNYKKILRFTLPSVIMMIFISIYGVVDGFFVSNFVGKTPFAAVNFIMPLLMILGPIGFLFGAGGSAVISQLLGQGKSEKAQKIFSLLVCLTVGISLVISAAGQIWLRPIAALLGAEGELLENCVIYARPLLCTLPFLMLQFEFQSFFITAEKPKLGLYSTILSGITNMVLDALFMAVFSLGIIGAAWATAISQVVGGLFPLIYFSQKNSSLLKFTRPVWDKKAFLKTLTNGSSELVSNLSMSLVGMLYNVQLLQFAGENGVAAYGIIMYVNFIFISAFIGYSTGIAPVIGYHLGCENHRELNSLLRKSLTIIGILSFGMFSLAEILALPLSAVFASYDADLLAMTVRGFRLYSFSFLFCGIGIFGSAFFTALGDGTTSALISFLRTLVLQVVCVMLLPKLLGLDGIWLAEVVANTLILTVTFSFLAAKRKKYHYGADCGK